MKSISFRFNVELRGETEKQAFWLTLYRVRARLCEPLSHLLYWRQYARLSSQVNAVILGEADRP